MPDLKKFVVITTCEHPYEWEKEKEYYGNEQEYIECMTELFEDPKDHLDKLRWEDSYPKIEIRIENVDA